MKKPDLYCFNPTCEPAIANGSPFYTAPATLRKFESDLSFLPAWLGDKEDWVVVPDRPNPVFMESLGGLGLELPQIQTEATALEALLGGASLGSLRPWGWSPATHRRLSCFLPFCDGDFLNSPVSQWQEGHKTLFSRLSAVTGLQGILESPSIDWLPDVSSIPVVCSSLSSIHHQLGKHAKAVVKTPWSSSGRGLLIFPNPDSEVKNNELLTGMLNQMGFVTVEPWLEKVADFSLQFFIQKGVPEFRGVTHFETDRRGRYLGNHVCGETSLHPDHLTRIEHSLETVVDLVKGALHQSGYTQGYEGWLGADALLFRKAEGKYGIHPLIEINGRYTMGALSLRCRALVQEGSTARFGIYGMNKGNFYTFCRQMEQEKPIHREGGKLVDGILPLTPAHEGTRFGAYLEVHQSSFAH
ncbi:MAG: hypothetical protein LWW85_09195 [Marinilabiliales bacterium]|nr:hypothetical protein [Marinilabiliales bacterium]